MLFIGGNQFFVLPKLVAAFEQQYPALKGHIFYETLPPSILRRQIAANNTITLGNLTLQVGPCCMRQLGSNALLSRLADVVKSTSSSRQPFHWC